MGDFATLPRPSIQAQIAELQREQTMRRRVYPHEVARGRLTQRDADYRMRTLDAAIDTLRAAEARPADRESGGGAP